MSTGAFMRMFWGDFLKNVMDLSTAEVGAYTLLIGHYFERGGLPGDDVRLARIARLPVPTWKRIRPNIEAFFEPGWRHAFLDREIEHARMKGERAAKGAQTRWNPPLASPIPDSARGKVLDESVTGKKIIETMDALCERIAEASSKHVTSESESESDKETTLDLRARDGILKQVLDAAGFSMETAAHPGLLMIGPILGCIAGGCDLELDVLATIRARTNPRVKSLQWFVEMIWESRTRRLAAAQPRAIPQATPNCQAPLEKNWRPSAELVDYGKTLGLSQADIDWTAEGLRNWAGGKARDDWPGLFKTWLVRKAEKDGKAAPSASRMIDPQMDPMKRATEFYLKKAEEKAR